MKQQYYKLNRGQVPSIDAFAPVDIGWRWCKDELPENKNDGENFSNIVMIKTKYNVLCHGWYDYELKEWTDIAESKVIGDEVVQWCKLPEPLKGGKDE